MASKTNDKYAREIPSGFTRVFFLFYFEKFCFVCNVHGQMLSSSAIIRSMTLVI